MFRLSSANSFRNSKASFSTNTVDNYKLIKTNNTTNIVKTTISLKTESNTITTCKPNLISQRKGKNKSDLLSAYHDTISGSSNYDSFKTINNASKAVNMQIISNKMYFIPINLAKSRRIY